MFALARVSKLYFRASDDVFLFSFSCYLDLRSSVAGGE